MTNNFKLFKVCRLAIVAEYQSSSYSMKYNSSISSDPFIALDCTGTMNVSFQPEVIQKHFQGSSRRLAGSAILLKNVSVGSIFGRKRLLVTVNNLEKVIG